MSRGAWLPVLLMVLMTGGTFAAPPPPGAETNVFFTAFEIGEGYDPDYELAGQKGWVMEGTGGNGLYHCGCGTDFEGGGRVLG